MSSTISEIVDVDITIENPVTSALSYSTMLLIVPAPVNVGTATMSTLTKIEYLSELADYGYSTTNTAAADYCVYQAVSTALAQSPGPEEIYLTVRQTVTENETTSAEPISTTLDRALRFNSWAGFCIVGTVTNADITAAAAWAEENMKLFGFTWTGTTIPVAITNYDHTFAVYAGDLDTTETNPATPYTAVAMMAKCFGYEPGSETWALKNLKNITPSALSSAKINTIKEANSNYYHTVADRAVTQTGVVGSGEWIDNIRFRDWLISEIEYRLAAFMTANTKVPYNDAGIAGIQNVIESVLIEGQRIGGIDADIYDGDEVDRAYTITVPKAANIAKATRRSRQLSNIEFSARLAGAIHKVMIRGKLVY